MKTKISLFVDDERTANHNFIRAYDYDDAIQTMEEYDVQIISLDHDLGLGKTGYDITKWMVENDYWPKVIIIHTANPVGSQNMIQLLEHYKPEDVDIIHNPNNQRKIFGKRFEGDDELFYKKRRNNNE